MHDWANGSLTIIKGIECLFKKKRLCLQCQLKANKKCLCLQYQSETNIQKDNDLSDVIIVTDIGNVIKIM